MPVLFAGAENKFVVDTYKAGAEDIVVTAEGPSCISLEAEETEPGRYVVTYRVNAAGTYLIRVKYASVHHIVGSPFKVVVKGNGEPAKWNEQAKVLLKAFSESTNYLGQGKGKVDPSKRVQTDTVSGRHIAGENEVICMGTGLQKAFVNHQASFIVDSSQAIGMRQFSV